LESLEQTENVVDAQGQPPPADQLHGAAILQIDARNDHAGSSWRTGTLFPAKYFFNAAIDSVSLWKIEAARPASALPRVKTSRKS
jgi:hypothetical protein